jgi:transketolase C-terminal domain/subunit
VPRDNLPVLERQDGSGPLWEADQPWQAATPYRRYPGARRVILAMGAPAYLAAEAAAALAHGGTPTDVHVVNGLPLPPNALADWARQYPEGMVTVEDGLIGTPDSGIRGFAALVAGAAWGHGVPAAHVGITDPRVAPSEGHLEVWEHFGITAAALVDAVRSL